MKSQTQKQKFLSFALAVVFLPPKKEMEDWSGSFATKKVSTESLQEMSSSSSSSQKSAVKTSNSAFSFNGIDKMSFAPSRGTKAQWEITLSPVEFFSVWQSGAWSGLSLSSHELLHFYVRQQRRGVEPKFRAYSLGGDWQSIDMEHCSPQDLVLLDQKIKEKNVYRLTRVRMLSSQELKREAAWELTAEEGQEYLGLKSDSCSNLVLEGWPKSFRVKL